MELAQIIALAMTIGFWGTALLGGLTVINLVIGRLIKASQFMTWGLMLGGSWQILAALIMPFSIAHGLYKPPGGWSQTTTFYWAIGIWMIVLAFVVRFLQLRIKDVDKK